MRIVGTLEKGKIRTTPSFALAILIVDFVGVVRGFRNLIQIWNQIVIRDVSRNERYIRDKQTRIKMQEDTMGTTRTQAIKTVKTWQREVNNMKAIERKEREQGSEEKDDEQTALWLVKGSTHTRARTRPRAHTHTYLYIYIYMCCRSITWPHLGFQGQ